MWARDRPSDRQTNVGRKVPHVCRAEGQAAMGHTGTWCLPVAVGQQTRKQCRPRTQRRQDTPGQHVHMHACNSSSSNWPLVCQTTLNLLPSQSGDACCCSTAATFSIHAVPMRRTCTTYQQFQFIQWLLQANWRRAAGGVVCHSGVTMETAQQPHTNNGKNSLSTAMSDMY